MQGNFSQYCLDNVWFFSQKCKLRKALATSHIPFTKPESSTIVSPQQMSEVSSYIGDSLLWSVTPIAHTSGIFSMSGDMFWFISGRKERVMLKSGRS